MIASGPFGSYLSAGWTALVLACVLVLGMPIGAHADDAVSQGSPPQIRAEGTNPRLGGKLAGYTAWIDAHDGASPDIVILGSSRAVQLDPRRIAKVSGATVYNAAISSGAARELLAIGDFVELLTPQDVPHLVVLLDLEAFDRRRPTKRVSTVLAAEAAIRAACSDPATCATAWNDGAREIVREAEAGAVGLPAASNNQRPDGMQINGNLENLDKQGADFTWLRNKRIRIRIESYKPGGGFDRLMPIPSAAVAKLIRQANARGDKPTVVVTTMHPECIRRCGPAGWNARRASVRAWLKRQQRTQQFRVIDLSFPGTWGGDASSFYDEIHLRPKAAAQVVDRLDELQVWDQRATPPASSPGVDVLAFARRLCGGDRPGSARSV